MHPVSAWPPHRHTRHSRSWEPQERAEENTPQGPETGAGKETWFDHEVGGVVACINTELWAPPSLREAETAKGGQA